MDGFILRKATIPDVGGIHSLLLKFGKEGRLLPRSYSELYSHIRDFFVVISSPTHEVIACGALSIVWKDLAEIRSVAVEKKFQKQGWGRRIVEACLSESLTLGIYRVFVLTYEKHFFETMGFQEVDKKGLHEKIWVDCFHCPKYPDACDEIAMLIEL